MEYMYGNNYGSGAQFSGAVIIVTLIIFAMAVIAMVLNYIGMWKVFKKAGIAGWKSLIPFYNSYLLYQIAMGNGWLFLLCIVPIANLIISIMCMFSLARAFRAGSGFAIGLIFLYPVFILMLGAGKYQYMGAKDNVYPV